ncbi:MULTISPECIES: hypothetical protein [unclassified Sinorhizobium]|uniref:hypothetical protein n=1 Tax=unclassified Sinorhizobium TaxID=2613772 RepID=UPI0035232226
MGEIPKDVMEVAKAIADDAIELYTVDHIEKLANEIARAILVERQRCADVAMKYKDRDPGEDGSGYWAAEEIANAILTPP